MSQKKILVPIDFSRCSIKALELAIKLAKKISARLIIMNACQKPVAHGDVTVTAYSRSLIKKAEVNVRRAYKGIEESIKDLEDVEYSFIIKHVFPQDAIISQALMENIDLIIMGTTGENGSKGILFGSNTQTVIENVRCPVLAIPRTYDTGKPFRKIVLAGEFQNATSKDTFEIFDSIARAYNAETHVLTVSEAPLKRSEEINEAQAFDGCFKNFTNTFYFNSGNLFDERINEYLEENEIDLLTLLLKSDSPFEQAFNKILRPKKASESKVPLLILHAD